MVLEPIITKAVISNSVKLIEKKMPLILMGAGLGLSTGSTILAVKVTPEATAAIKQIKRTPDLMPSERNWEIFKRVVPLYAPAALAAVGGAACVISSYSINVARLAELGAAYAVAQNSLTTYRKELDKRYGKEVEEDITQNVKEQVTERYCEDKTASMPLPASNDSNMRLFKDMLTMQFFWSTSSRIVNTVLDINNRIQYEGHIRYTEYAIDVNMEACDATDNDGWLMGDVLTVEISEDEYTTPQGWKYREVRVDTNPKFKQYLDKGEYM